jgi:sugar phosphate permease
VQSPFFFFVTFIMIAIGAGMAGFLAATTSIVNWFERKRSTAIGLVTAGFALGGMAVPITVQLLETFGWRATAFGSGVAVLALGLPLVQIVRHRPGPYGHHPDGIAPGDPRHAAHAAARTHVGVDFSLRQALHTPAFWFIALGHGSALVIVSAVQVHTVAHVKESLGYSLAGASGVITLMTMLSTGTLTGGWLGDPSTSACWWWRAWWCTRAASCCWRTRRASRWWRVLRAARPRGAPAAR